MERAEGTPVSRFERLNEFLASDPANLPLLADAAGAALDEGRLAEAVEMVERYAATAPLPPSLINVLGLCALSQGHHADAAAIFESLLAGSPDDPVLCFNLAWAKGQTGDHEAVLELLNEARTPAAALVVVRSLHHLGRVDEALAIGDAWEKQDGSPDLWGALASVALDAEDMDRASRWGHRGQGSPDGLAALGVLAMAEARDIEARALFEQALALRPDSARGLLGMGSVLLGDGQPDKAARRFDEAAAVFGDHLGSWIAAGWAWLIAGDISAARERFERVLAIDDAFGEAYGGLAVLDVMEGRRDEAQRCADIALRLDRQGLGGALARSLLLEQAGDSATAARVRDRALNAPIGPNGQSVTQLLALRAARVGRSAG